MLTASQIAGFIGVGLAGVAYVPQIWHLARERCSAGISRLAFAGWLVASALVTSHAIATQALVFTLLGAVQIVAILLILIYATKYRSSQCAGHVVVALAGETGVTGGQTLIAPIPNSVEDRVESAVTVS
jgi:uncharacterized protein with PQ loop repeat